MHVFIFDPLIFHLFNYLDYVTLTNEEDGVAVVLEKLLEYKKNE